MTKKEFKKKCQEENHQCTKLMSAGATVAIFGLLVVFIAFFFTGTIQIVAFIIGGLIALVGIILDIIGEIILNKEYKRVK